MFLSYYLDTSISLAVCNTLKKPRMAFLIYTIIKLVLLKSNFWEELLKLKHFPPKWDDSPVLYLLYICLEQIP